MHRLVAARRANGLIARAAGPEKAGDTRLFGWVGGATAAR
jgi:hypothetical protein